MIIPHLILKKDGRILLTRRSPSNKIWPYWHCITGQYRELASYQEKLLFAESEEEIGIKIKGVNLKTIIFILQERLF